MILGLFWYKSKKQLSLSEQLCCCLYLKKCHVYMEFKYRKHFGMDEG